MSSKRVSRRDESENDAMLFAKQRADSAQHRKHKEKYKWDKKVSTGLGVAGMTILGIQMFACIFKDRMGITTGWAFVLVAVFSFLFYVSHHIHSNKHAKSNVILSVWTGIAATGLSVWLTIFCWSFNRQSVTPPLDQMSYEFPGAMSTILLAINSIGLWVSYLMWKNADKISDSLRFKKNQKIMSEWQAKMSFAGRDARGSTESESTDFLTARRLMTTASP